MTDLEAVWEQCRRWDDQYETVIRRSGERPGSTTQRGSVAAENRSGSGAASTARSLANTLDERAPA